MNIYLKKASEKDCDLLYNWSNDELVRKNSFNENKIENEEHKKWFFDKISSNDYIIYICYLNNIALGYARIEIKNQEAKISYAIDKDYRGNGLAIKVLFELENKIKLEKLKIKSLIGFVKNDNIPSIKSFQGLNYTEFKDNEYLKYVKIIN